MTERRAGGPGGRSDRTPARYSCVRCGQDGEHTREANRCIGGHSGVRADGTLLVPHCRHCRHRTEQPGLRERIASLISGLEAVGAAEGAAPERLLYCPVPACEAGPWVNPADVLLPLEVPFSFSSRRYFHPCPWCLHDDPVQARQWQARTADTCATELRLVLDEDARQDGTHQPAISLPDTRPAAGGPAASHPWRRPCTATPVK
jgi:DNA-directed RNA polymerase subunit RPC12/RpoP